MGCAAVDPFGNALTLDDASSLGAVHDFAQGFAACEARVVHLLDAAPRDASAYVQAGCAALHLFAESPDGPVNARPFVERALAAAPRATAREQAFVQAIAAWARGDIDTAVACHAQALAEHPRDLVALKLAQYHLFNRGDVPGMLRLALPSRRAAADLPWVHGMTAFALEQCDFLREAEAAARQALRLSEREPWAQHAIAHVMLTEGRLTEGLDFMQAASVTWTALNSFMVTHNWWHLALFLIELDRADDALALYDREVWGVVKAYSQDQIGAVSLLARLELAGMDVGDRWQDVADHMSGRVHDHVLPFLDLQYLYGLARAGRPEADALHASLRTHAQQAGGVQAGVWRDVAVPAADGLLAHARGDWAGAVRGLGAALPRLLEIGGSHAQRDLFEQIHLDALTRSGATAGALHLLRQRARLAPGSKRLERQARAVQASAGLGEVESTAA